MMAGHVHPPRALHHACHSWKSGYRTKRPEWLGVSGQGMAQRQLGKSLTFQKRFDELEFGRIEQSAQLPIPSCKGMIVAGLWLVIGSSLHFTAGTFFRDRWTAPVPLKAVEPLGCNQQFRSSGFAHRVEVGYVWTWSAPEKTHPEWQCTKSSLHLSLQGEGLSIIPLQLLHKKSFVVPL